MDVSNCPVVSRGHRVGPAPSGLGRALLASWYCHLRRITCRDEWLLVSPKSGAAPSPVFPSVGSRHVALVVVGLFLRACVHLSYHGTIYLFMNEMIMKSSCSWRAVSVITRTR